MKTFLIDAPLAPVAPGYIHFWIIDLDFAPRANWRVDRIEPVTNSVIETQYTDSYGIATFQDLQYGNQQIHYFRVEGQPDLVHQVVASAMALGVIRLVRL